MSRPLINSPGGKPFRIMRNVLAGSGIGLFFLSITSSWLFAQGPSYEITPSKLHDALFVVDCLLTASFVVFVITFIISFFYIVRHRKQVLKYDLHGDVEFVNRLLTFDKATLTYGLLQYPHRWLFLQNLITVLAGDLRKLGLFPALVALLISAAVLFKAYNSPFLRDFLAIVSIYYVLAFFSFLLGKRPQQVIQLLEYAIEHAGQGNANPSETNASTPSV